MDNPVKKPFGNLKRRNPHDFETMPQVCGGYTSFRPCDKPMILRHCRQFKAKWFRNGYIYGSGMDRKTCIWSCDSDSWLDKSSGIMWVGVHGIDSICVVTRTGDLDIKRVRGSLKNHTIESFLHHFRKTVIAEIEDLADPSSKLCPEEFCFFPNTPNKLRQRVDQSIKKPFGIVSAGTDDVHEESGPEASNDVYEEQERDANRVLEAIERIQERERVRKGVQKVMLPAPAQRDEKNTIKYLQEKMESDPTLTINETVQALESDEKKAVKFLREKMESNVAFTVDETIQAAISAFQHLFGKKFKANEIGVTVMDPADYIVSNHEAKCNDVYAKELEIHDIEKHLAAINEPSSGGGGGGGGGNSTVTSLKEDDMNENEK